MLLALVGSANAATLSPDSSGTSYNLDYTETTTPTTTLSGHIDTIKTHVGTGDFTAAYTHYDNNVKSLVTGVTSAIDTLFDTHNSDAGSDFPTQVAKYLNDVKVRQMKKPLSLLAPPLLLRGELSFRSRSRPLIHRAPPASATLPTRVGRRFSRRSPWTW